MYKLAVKESLDKQFKKLKKKDREMLMLIDRKVQEILDDPYRFKPLRKPLQKKRRVHVGRSFVLIYEINEEEKIVALLDFDHHDNIYKTQLQQKIPAETCNECGKNIIPVRLQGKLREVPQKARRKKLVDMEDTAHDNILLKLADPIHWNLMAD